MSMSLLSDLLSCRVLTMEYLEGVSLTDLAAVQRVTDARPDEVLINALNTWFLSLTMCPTFHADVHAGTLQSYDTSIQRCKFS